LTPLRLRILLVLCLLLVIPACTGTVRDSSLPDLQRAYGEAIRDAEVAEPGEISRDLLAIVPSNDALRWNKEKDEILVVTWTSWDGYDDRVGTAMELSREVWVTVVPEVKAFCHAQRITPTQLPLRLEQLLGLPPEAGKTKFAEMWVSPEDLFRPAPDPEVSDHEAELDFPVSARFVTISEAHRRWFFDLKQRSYGAGGYPWTRLGYTYDWGNRESEIGVSEFVIPAGATVTIHAVSDTLTYCQ